MSEGSKLSEEELFKIFKSLHVPIRMSDLKSPTKEFVVSVFDIFLRDLQINLASPLLRPFESISHLENPELYEEGQGYILLAFSMNQIMRNVGQLPVQITISDIVAPKPKKTKKILNYLVVLWTYVLQKQHLFSEVCNSLQSEIQQAEDIANECYALDTKYQECVEKLNAIRTSKEELRKINAAKEEVNQKHEKTQKTMTSDYQKLKEKESQLQTERVNIDLMIATNKETLNELDQLILSSPEKIKTDAQKLKDMIKEVEEKIQEKEQEKKEKKKENQNKMSLQEEYVKRISKVEKLHNELQSLMESIQNLTSVHKKCQEENKELQEMQAAQENKEVMTNFYQEKYTKIQHLKKKQIEEINKTYEMLQRRLSEEKKQCDSVALSITDLEKEIDDEVDSAVAIVDQCKAAEVETKRYKEAYKQQMLAINTQFRENCEQISRKSKKIFESLD